MNKTKRLELHAILVKTLGSRNVYFQPPNTITMSYPCIVYKRNQINTRYADNKVYSNRIGYQIIVIDQNPDSDILEKVQSLPLCRFVQHYTSDNLNHDVFTLFY